jgi:trehalose-6-phosphatase
MHDPQSLSLSSGCFLDALTSGQLGPAVPVYLGNAATAEEAFRTVNGRGLTIVVTNPPGRTAARYYLQNPAQVSCFLARVLSRRLNGKGRHEDGTISSGAVRHAAEKR